MATLWTELCNEDGLPELGRRLAADLGSSVPFCLWLCGPLGAGKTTLTRYILRALGLSEAIAVTSPTYTYMNEYRIEDRWYAHLDLYRAEASLEVENLGLADVRPFAGIFVEWPNLLPETIYLRPTHLLNIAYADRGQLRTYELSTRGLD